VRGLNGYGNAGLFRDDGSVVQWLHTAKYPASLAYLACELGIAWLLLAAFWRADLSFPGPFPLTVLGQTALFLLSPARAPAALRARGARGLLRHSGLVVTYLAAAESSRCSFGVRAVPPVQAGASESLAKYI
jgi:hypothetical protein